MELARQNFGLLDTRTDLGADPKAKLGALSFVRKGSAVCYQCSFTSDEGGSTCPDCNFPLIMQSELSPPGGFRIRDVLRRDSLRIGAPPLPGVDAAPRKAQLLSEARKRLRDAARSAARAQTEPAVSEKRNFLWNVLPLSCFAVGFGVVAAAVQNLL
jgi:hypothetical protein